MSKDGCLAVLDIGTAKTVAFVLDAGHQAKPYVRGSGLAATLGLHKNVVVDAEALTFSLRNALFQAEQNAGCRVDRLLCNTVGIPVNVFISRGTTAISEKTKEISAGDIDRVIEASKILPHNSGQELIYAAPRRFYIDGRPGLKVLGKRGVRLDVETCVVTADKQQLGKLAGIMNGLHVAPLSGWIYSGTAMAGSILAEEEKTGQVLVIDIGAGTADVTLVDERQPVFAFSLPVAGRHITNDLSVGLGISLDEAEQFKIEHGLACELAKGKIPPENADFRQKTGTSQKVFTDIIEARLREIFSLIQQRVLEAGHQIPSSVVLAGGTAMLPGLDVLLASMWAAKTRVLNPPYINGMPVNFNNTSYVSIAAMSIYAASLNFLAEKPGNRFLGGIFDKFSGFWKAFSGV